MRETNSVMSTARMEAFSDGIFAIIVTLLILGIKLPEIPRDKVAEELPRQLLVLWPRGVSYALSFLVVGVYWVDHHNLCRVITRCDRGLLWLNNLFLMLAAFLPFPAGLLGQYGDQRIIILFYAFSLILSGCCLSLLWFYATYKRRLVHQDTSARLIRIVHGKILTLPAVALVAVCVSFISPRLSVLVLFGSVFFFVLPSALDSHLDRHQRTTENAEQEGKPSS